MTTLFAVLIFILCVAAMAVGVIFSKKELKKRCSADPTEPCSCEQDKSCDCNPL